MNPGHADVGEAGDPGSHRDRDGHRLFRNREIAGPRRHDQQLSRERFLRDRAGQPGRASQRIPLEPGEFRTERLRLFGAGAGAEEGAVHRGEPLADRHRLIDRLSGGKHHFRLSLAERPVMVQPGEFEIFGGKVGKPVERPGGGEDTGGNLSEQGFQAGPVHAGWSAGSR